MKEKGRAGRRSPSLMNQKTDLQGMWSDRLEAASYRQRTTEEERNGLPEEDESGVGMRETLCPELAGSVNFVQWMLVRSCSRRCTSCVLGV